MSSAFDSAKIRTADGRVGFDALKLVEIPVEGIALKDYPNHKITVRTKNTTYLLTTRSGRVLAQAFKDGAEPPRYLRREQEIAVHGSTYGGSWTMLRIGFIGVDMHLEFTARDDNYEDHPPKTVTTSAIQSVTVRELPNE